MAEFDLTSAQWSGAYHSARYNWDSFVSRKIFPGPRVSADYHEWWQIVCPPPLLSRSIKGSYFSHSNKIFSLSIVV